ncbi:hypothetical protein LINPERHAP1_LOCUS22611 [Linum perenne]
MAVDPTFVGTSSVNIWASIVTGERFELRFVEDSKKAFVEGVLKLPKEVLEVGTKKLKAAVVAQFLGLAPPIRVIKSMINHLRGYEERCCSLYYRRGFPFSRYTLRLSIIGF